MAQIHKMLNECNGFLEARKIGLILNMGMHQIPDTASRHEERPEVNFSIMQFNSFHWLSQHST